MFKSIVMEKRYEQREVTQSQYYHIKSNYGFYVGTRKDKETGKYYITW